MEASGMEEEIAVWELSRITKSERGKNLVGKESENNRKWKQDVNIVDLWNFRQRRKTNKRKTLGGREKSWKFCFFFKETEDKEICLYKQKCEKSYTSLSSKFLSFCFANQNSHQCYSFLSLQFSLQFLQRWWRGLLFLCLFEVGWFQPAWERRLGWIFRASTWLLWLPATRCDFGHGVFKT